jgi:CBS domain-containing protein
LKEVARLLVSKRVSGLPVVARDAANAMTAPAITIRPERRVAEAAALMLDRSVSRLPVVDHHGKLLGVVTRAGLVRAFVREDERSSRRSASTRSCARFGTRRRGSRSGSTAVR